METTGTKAAAWLRKVADIVEQKSESYGDSVGNPVRIFSKSAKDEAINVRIDDKLSRIANGKTFPGDNDLQDLVGYIALKAASQDTASGNKTERDLYRIHLWTEHGNVVTRCVRAGCLAIWIPNSDNLEWNKGCIKE